MQRSWWIIIIIIIILLITIGCGVDKKTAPTGIELFYDDIQKVEKAELIDIVGQKAGYIEGHTLTELINIILESKPGPYPEGYTGGEIEAGITLIYQDKKINLTVAPRYLAVNDPEPKRYSLKQPHLIFNDGISSKEIFHLFEKVSKL